MKLRPSYRPPTEKQLAGKLLDTTIEKVKKTISDAIDRAVNITVQIDGWSDVNRSSFLNVALYTGRPIFLKSIDPGAQ